MKAFLFFTGLIVPVIMIFTGWFMHKHPPKDVNWVIGYRTGRSMQSPEAWLFAQKKIGEIWKKAGAVTLLVSAAAMIPFLFLSVDAFSVASVVIMFSQLAVLLLTIPPVERALREKFPDPKK
jgi:uncharacterized membrane protein